MFTRGQRHCDEKSLKAKNTLVFHVFTDFVCDGGIEAFFLCHFLFHFDPGQLCDSYKVVRDRGDSENCATLSSLSTAEEMGRIFPAETPHTSKMPSKILRWLTWQNEKVINHFRQVGRI